MSMAFTDPVGWLQAMRDHAKSHPTHLWMPKEGTPYFAFLAFDKEDPDPSHVQEFILTLGAAMRGSPMLRRLQEGPNERERLAVDLGLGWFFVDVLIQAESQWAKDRANREQGHV